MDETQTSGDEDYFPGFSSVDQKRSEPESSCVSMKSVRSMDRPMKFNSGDTQPDFSSVQQKRSESSCVSVKSDASIDPPMKFKSGDSQPGLSSVQQKRSEPESSCVSMRSDASMVCQEQFKSGDSRPGLGYEVLNMFRSNLLKKFGCLYEGTAMQGNSTLLNEIYTELYITESESGEISNEHEVRQIETQSRVQKFILDCAEEKENQDIQLIFPLPFREINLMKDKTLSLSDLLHVFFPETKEMEISSDEYKVLLIFDGLDECHLSLYFQRN
ncbi:uncharacterized protein LOC107677796 [Sinocyclocheilus anshuiensis]|uniref:uncharacterized protein LOC107677796 n=1 Tax=Sinocyclocheilus anshuiensis TaxID=1608454 RepID=UPI0007B91A39|nr:PREDICTED: uncharacterized protein LOC107677796 [Sinocyclocheilus anshuiensis]